MPLTDLEVRRAAAREKTYRLSDGRGMYLEISPSGGKYWRLKYRFNDRERKLALGVYPDVTLARARRKRDEARAMLADGIDPGQAKKTRNAWRGSTRPPRLRPSRSSGSSSRRPAGHRVTPRRSWGG